MSTRLDAIVDVTLHGYANTSLSSLEELCNVWRMRIRNSNTAKATAQIAIPWPLFKRLFKCNPVAQTLPVPKSLSKWLLGWKVSGIEFVEVRDNAQKAQKET